MSMLCPKCEAQTRVIDTETQRTSPPPNLATHDVLFTSSYVVMRVRVCRGKEQHRFKTKEEHCG
jgi:hypothetical protein